VSRSTHRGPWADTIRGARDAALAEGGVATEEYVVCEYSDPLWSKLVPLDESWPELAVEAAYSEARDQFRATVRKL
jgi:hypothetical protein